LERLISANVVPEPAGGAVLITAVFAHRRRRFPGRRHFLEKFLQ
jgi:hypothetical protein